MCGPRGEDAYLARLRCPDGSPVTVVGRSSVGTREPLPGGDRPATREDWKKAFGPKDPADETTHVVDTFEIACLDQRTRIFLDMYHCDKPPPQESPPGFTLTPSE